MKSNRFALLAGLLACAGLPLVSATYDLGAAENAKAEKAETANNAEAEAADARLLASLKYLASDELEGRGVGTKGLDLAADYIAAEFKKLGLKTEVFDGQPFQKFKMTIGSKLGAKNELTITGPEAKPFDPHANPHGDPHAFNPHADPHADPHAAPPKKDAPKKEDAKKEESKKAHEPKTEAEPKKEPEAKAENDKAPKAPAPQEVKSTQLALGKDFNPMALSGSGRLNLPVAFVGYGITDKKQNYDDYAGIDVKGKAVLILRKIPQQGNPHSPFGGDALRNEHAPFTKKVSNAFQHGAEAVLFVNDGYDLQQTRERQQKQLLDAAERLAVEDEAQAKVKDPTPEQKTQAEEKRKKIVADIARLAKQLRDGRDPVFPFGFGGDGAEGRALPVVHITRAMADKMLKGALGKDLAALEKSIDDKLAPVSADLAGWKLQGEITVERTEAEVKNVVGVLEGEGPKADETIVIGAHYDHLGLGGEGSFVPNEKTPHNGADDNASGASTLIEVARILATRTTKLPRRVVFIAFTAEERGLIGSARYVREPLIPLNKTVAMLNMDMVGRLTDDKLIVYGTGTATEFEPLIEKLNGQYKFKITKQPEGFGPSDHSSFYAKQIPVFHFFTGTHKDYHRPSDDFDKVNIAGMRRVGALVADTALAIADAPEPPKYVEVKQRANPRAGGGDRPYFGSIPDFSQEKPGYALMGVTKGGPAEKAGLKAGDIIIQLGDSKIGNLEDFDGALRKFKAGDKAPVTVQRDGKEVKVEVVLDPPR